jgi:sialate O-acetylesterase
MLRLLPLILLAAPLFAGLQLASPFTDHMVLQRELPVPVWGTASPGEQVTVEFAGQKLTATTDATGNWRVTLAPLTTSAEPRDLLVTSGTPQSKVSTLKLTDVLVGEVWLASGQSNMDFSVSQKVKYFAGVLNEEQEIAAANHPLIRMFVGEAQKALTPQARVGGKWLVCSPETVPGFSAVGYFFARALQRELQVPVGVIVEAYGASTAQAWIRREAMLGDPRFKAVLDRFDEIVAKHVPPTPAEITDWQHAVELAKAEGKRPPRAPGADPAQDQHNPTVMFNGLIAPIVPYAVRGVIWYQGESITAPRELFPAWNELLITDWRRLWGR